MDKPKDELSTNTRKPSEILRKTDHNFWPKSSDIKLRTETSHRHLTEWQENNDFIVTRRANIYPKSQTKSAHKQNENNFHSTKRISNFQRLKKQAQLLEQSRIIRDSENMDSSQPLGSLHKCEVAPSEYFINNQFLSSKKVSVIDQYRYNIKKINKKRMKSNKWSIHSNIFKNKNVQNSDFQPSFTIQRVENTSIQRESAWNSKKMASVSAMAKKFYQPSNAAKKHRNKSISHSVLNGPKCFARAMQITSRQCSKNKDVVIICL